MDNANELFPKMEEYPEAQMASLSLDNVEKLILWDANIGIGQNFSDLNKDTMDTLYILLVAEDARAEVADHNVIIPIQSPLGQAIMSGDMQTLLLKSLALILGDPVD